MVGDPISLLSGSCCNSIFRAVWRFRKLGVDFMLPKPEVFRDDSCAKRFFDAGRMDNADGHVVVLAGG